VITGQKVYQQPATPGPEWSMPGQTTSPSGFSFLGEYGNETLTLSLDDLPEHTTVVVSFDLHILRSWDGNAEVVDLAGELSRFLDGRRGLGESVGPDIWQVEGGETLLLRTTFNNWPASNPGQAYPGAYPGDNHPAQSGAEGLNTLGYTFRDIPMDATYHIQLSLAGHTSTSLDLRFSAEGLQSLADESWGLSGVQVIVSGGGDLLPYRVYQPIIQR
jgi:hypothetical protein